MNLHVPQFISMLSAHLAVAGTLVASASDGFVLCTCSESVFTVSKEFFWGPEASKTVN